MIVVTRLNRTRFAVNPDLIERIQERPDTTITMVDGNAFVVIESMDEVIAQITGYRARVLATAAHSRSPSLAAFGDDVAIAWIEEAPLGEGTSDAHFGTTTSSYGAMLAKLDAKGKPIDEPMRTRGAGEGFPTSIMLTSDEGLLRAAVARAQEDAVVLDLLQWPGRGPVRAYPLVKLDGPPSMDVALAITGSTVFFDDEALQSQGGDWRVRKLVISSGK